MASNGALNARSSVLTQGASRAGARAMFKAIGYTDEDLRKPLIGIANTWIETMPCGFHLRELAEVVKEGVRAAGGTPMEFNTIAISDGITMGTEGMKASLVSREVIADSIELCARGYQFDAIVALAGCDKTLPGSAMAIARLNIPAVLLYGGSTAAGRLNGKDITIVDVYEAIGAHACGKIDDAQLKAVEDNACPGAGACGGQYTANTMATTMEFLGLSPVGSVSPGATDPRATRLGAPRRRVGHAIAEGQGSSARSAHARCVRECDRCRGRNRRIDQRRVAFARDRARSGRSAHDRRLRRDQRAHADRGGLRPGGTFWRSTSTRAGGTQLIARRLLEGGLVHGDVRTLGGDARAKRSRPRSKRPASGGRDRGTPFKPRGGLVDPARQLSRPRVRRQDCRQRADVPSRAGARL